MSKALLAQFLAISALAAVFAASSANAQEYAPYPPQPTARPAEEVIVIAPRHRRSAQTSDIGAPIGDVGITRPVRFDDLDLSTPWGVQRLRERVRYTAHELCRRLDMQYPVNAPDEPNDRFGSANCYRDAIADGMDQADQAIEQAQSYRD